MWEWIELQLMGERGEAVSIQDKLATIIKLAEMAAKTSDTRLIRQYMGQISVLSYIG